MIAPSRPRLRVKVSPATRVARALTYVITAAGCAAGLIAYPTLSETIPIHWNARGVEDGWGSPVSLLVIIALWLAIVAGIEVLSRKPHILNYPMDVTDANAPGLYRAAVDMLVWLNLELAILFASLVAQSYGFALSTITGFALAATFVTLIIGVARMMRADTAD
ncbi:DUF1648 domain-containing protein [Demequina sediminicola]|uniref:DUF1648 domain-containing protein n=1 Tax=Demequina sediminicola TaxID=1095026 RepID=UPI0007860E93|nr:DUF1648 domain-containing protein [Demequina sediminicola]